MDDDQNNTAPEEAEATAPVEGKPPADLANEGDAGGQEVVGSAAMRPVFLGNLYPNYSSAQVQEVFNRPIVPPGTQEGTYKSIPVDRVDLKRGYCFVFLKDAESQQDKEVVERFVSAINGMEVEGVSSALRAEFARGDGRVKRKEDDRRKNIQASETLFVVNFHEETTKREDLQMLFEPFGELVRIDMKRNYAFVQFRTIEEASRAKEATNQGKLDQSVLTVEFVARQRSDQDRRRRRDDRGGDRRGGGGDRRGGPDRFRDGHPADRFERGGGGDRHDRDRHHDDYPLRGGGRDDFRGRGRDRSPGGYRGGSPGGRRGGSPEGYRGGSPGGYRRRSRSRSRSPRGYRSRSPPRRYDDRNRGGRYDDYRDGGRRAGGGNGGGAPGGAGGGGNNWSPDHRESRRSPERDTYRGGRDDRGYRG